MALRQAECGNHFGPYPVHNVATEVSHMLKCVDMRYPVTTALERTELLYTLTPQQQAVMRKEGLWWIIFCHKNLCNRIT